MAVVRTSVPGYPVTRGKVRDVYELHSDSAGEGRLADRRHRPH